MEMFVTNVQISSKILFYGTLSLYQAISIATVLAATCDKIAVMTCIIVTNPNVETEHVQQIVI